VFYLALAAAVITIVFSMSIFPWAAHKWLGPDSDQPGVVLRARLMYLAAIVEVVGDIEIENAGPNRRRQVQTLRRRGNPTVPTWPARLGPLGSRLPRHFHLA
jgi:hypothetical protein